ncbi:EF hand domain protein [Hyphomonas neptunium ATCC 15444]|uniref:EF hand domain protein n=2 Tax=Hyphomonas TaxID=85 RepID=Q0C2K8_HYPNA|nr:MULTISPECIES: EF-hand domain-containing protein [Hyphomonas]ABI76474.1 EF hand domain protein [Hyphomonas neptunium ATCC 15444]KCZ95730.1 EF hand domain-containing protein [Hyphomonas hirschiana VP5]
MKRSTLAFASMAVIALAMPLAAQAGPGKGHRGHGAHLMQMDANADGNITRAEAEVSLATRFATIDANSDGFVTQDEMKAHHEAKRAEMKAKWEARKAEAEAAGEPVREGKPKREKDPAKAAEWKAKKAEKAAEHWAEMDSDSDGQLNTAEFTAAHITFFDKMDADSDGTITKAEMDAAKAKKKERRGEWRDKMKAEAGE